MGLDMYLNKRKFVGWNYEFMREDMKNRGLVIPDLSKFGINANRVSFIEETVCEWRKANAIHRWFVENVQDGNDDCSLKSTVTKEHISELLTIISGVLQFPEYAMKELPPQAGFFFGNAELDEWYWENLRMTKVMLEELYRNWDEEATYYYQSSW